MNGTDFDFSYDHLLPYERAARIFCKMNAQDPDEEMEIPHPFLQGVALKRPAWHFPAENMINLSQMLVAMKQAAAGAGTPGQVDGFPGH